MWLLSVVISPGDGHLQWPQINLNLPEVFAGEHGLSVHLAFFVSGSQLISLILNRQGQWANNWVNCDACMFSRLSQVNLYQSWETGLSPFYRWVSERINHLPTSSFSWWLASNIVWSSLPSFSRHCFLLLDIRLQHDVRYAFLHTETCNSRKFSYTEYLSKLRWSDCTRRKGNQGLERHKRLSYHLDETR